MEKRCISMAVFFIFLLKDFNGILAIVGGDKLNITRVPFALSLRHNDSHICGSAIISTKWAITAAHCIYKYGDDPKEYSVRSGSSYRSSEGKIHQVTKIIVHDDFNATIVDYDIAVIQVDPSFEFDDSRQPVKLPDLNGQDNDDDNTGTVVGWGAFSDLDDKKLSQVLKSTTLPKVEKNECIEDYKDSYVVTDRELCFGFRSGHDDACKGDSGGPLYNKDEILIGITSWGDECAAKNSPGIYTRVQSFRDWIQEKTCV